jgi:hypothetical protein
MSKRTMPVIATAIGLGASIFIPLYSVYMNARPRYLIIPCCDYDVGWEVDNFSLPGMVQRMDGITLCVHLTMYALFCGAIAIAVERWLAYYYAEHQTDAYAAKMAAAIEAHRLDKAGSLAADYPKSPLAAVVHVSLHPGGVCATDGGGPSLESWHHAIAVKTTELKRGLWHLSAISCTVPLISLLLLVTGISHSLRNAMYSEGSLLPYLVRNIADALWAMVFSMMFGISALWFHKYLNAKCSRLTMEMERRSLALLSQIARLPQTIQAHKALRPYDTQPLDLRVTERLTRG